MCIRPGAVNVRCGDRDRRFEPQSLTCVGVKLRREFQSFPKCGGEGDLRQKLQVANLRRRDTPPLQTAIR